MKLLKLTLGDGKNYTFCTFSVLEQRVMKKEYQKYADLQDESNKIQFELDEKGNIKKNESGNWIPRDNLTKEDKDKIQKIEDDSFEYMFDVFRKSICKNHQEFKKTGDEAKDTAIIETLQNLVDMNDLRKITQFAFNGTYLRDENVLDCSFEMTISEEVKDGDK